MVRTRLACWSIIPARPQWGPGKVVAVGEDRIHVYFRNELEKKASRPFLTGTVAPTVSVEQTDSVAGLAARSHPRRHLLDAAQELRESHGKGRGEVVGGVGVNHSLHEQRTNDQAEFDAANAPRQLPKSWTLVDSSY